MIVAAAAFFALSASAQADTKMKCGCYDDVTNIATVTKAAAQENYKVDCVSGEKWTKFDNSLSIQEKNVKVYLEGGQKIIGDKDIKLRFRPRNGKCLDNVMDGVKGGGSVNWTGPNCDNGSYQHLSGFQLTRPNSEDAPTLYMSAFQAQVTGPNKYKGFAFYNKKDDGKKYLMALCLENK